MEKIIPLCFPPRTYELWDSGPAFARCSDHCVDCTPTYQLRMKKIKRCEHPETMFTVEDGGVVGHRKSS